MLTVLKLEWKSFELPEFLTGEKMAEWDHAFPGLKWKLWTKSNETGNPCWIILLETEAQAENYVTQVKQKCTDDNIACSMDVCCFGVLESMSRLTHAQIDVPTNSAPYYGELKAGRESMVLLQVSFNIPGVVSILPVKVMDAFYPRKAALHLLTLPGLIWKIWAMKPHSSFASGLYLFDSTENVNKRIAHVMDAFPKKPFLSKVRCETFAVDQESSRMTAAPLDLKCVSESD